MGLIAAALLTALAMLSARTTVYTITSKRLVMRIGMALPVTINLPFNQIDGASLRLFANGSGDIPLKVTAKERVAYLLLWPHARPFHFAHPQPSLRCIANADDVAGLLAAALAGTATAPLSETATARQQAAAASTGGGLSHGKRTRPQPRSAASAGPELRHGAARARCWWPARG